MCLYKLIFLKEFPCLSEGSLESIKEYGDYFFIEEGTYLPLVTIVTERTIVKNVEDNPKQLASLGFANAYANMLTILTNSRRPLSSAREKWPR